MSCFFVATVGSIAFSARAPPLRASARSRMSSNPLIFFHFLIDALAANLS
jgi:hypothetical protein